MAEKKITKRECFEELKALVADREDLVAFLDHEIELLNRKTSKSGTLTPSQKDNLAIAEIVKDILAENDKGLAIGAMLKDTRIVGFQTHDGNAVSSQKLTAVVAKLVDTKDVIREVEKKVAYFRLNYGEVADEVEG